MCTKKAASQPNFLQRSGSTEKPQKIVYKQKPKSSINGTMFNAENKGQLEHESLQLCRVCNVESTQFASLYKPHIINGELTTLATVFKYCTNLQAIEDEQFLPGHMCEPCIGLLAIAYDFKQAATKTDQELRERATRSPKNKTLNSSSFRFLSPAKLSQEKLANAFVDVDLQADADADAIIESADDDEYIYLFEETDSLEASVNSIEFRPGDEFILEEITEDGLQMETDEVFEEDLALDDNYELEPDSTFADMDFKERNKSSNPALKCLICGKQLSTSNSFKYHMQLHGDNKPFECSICSDTFKTRNAYDGHMTLHNPNNPNKCTICGKTYRQPSSLRSHLYSHSGYKPFTCGVCGKGLTQKSGYKKHMLTHTGEKPHSCDKCGRRFRYSSNLIAHKRSHSQHNLNLV